MDSNRSTAQQETATNTRDTAAADDKRTASVSDEVVYFEGSPALRGYLGRFLMSTLIALALIVSGFVMHNLGWWVPLAGVITGAIVAGMPLIFARTVRYRISNYRIDYERGVLSKDIDTLELWHVDDLKFHQSLLDRILLVGEIIVVSGDETTPLLHIRAIPDPRPVFETLKSRIITVKRQRGVIKLEAG